VRAYSFSPVSKSHTPRFWCPSFAPDAAAEEDDEEEEEEDDEDPAAAGVAGSASGAAGAAGETIERKVSNMVRNEF